MHYTETVYRPAFEGDVPLLQVTTGCSYNKCSFCSMYRDTPFRASPMEEVEEDLQELRETYDYMPRLFLVNGDPFALSTVYGEGYDYPLLYGAYAGNVVGAVPVGIETFESIGIFLQVFILLAPLTEGSILSQGDRMVAGREMHIGL